MPHHHTPQSAPPAMQTATDLLELLDSQYRDYTAMYRVSERQRAHIAEEDVNGLQATCCEIRTIMERIRLRQKEIPPLNDVDAEVVRRSEAIGELIRNLQAIRGDNEGSARRLMTRTGSELRQFQQGRQAARGYRSPKVIEARFYDGKR